MSGGSFSFLPGCFEAMAEEVQTCAGDAFPEACAHIETLCMQLDRAVELLDRHCSGDQVVTEAAVLAVLALARSSS